MGSPLVTALSTVQKHNNQLDSFILTRQSKQSIQSIQSIDNNMKSKAAQRFNRLHPASHAEFQSLLQTARKRKESCEETSDSNEQEVANMIKNKALTKFTEEDQTYCEAQRKKRKLVSKKLTWSKNLIQVQILLDCHYSDIED